MLSLPLRAAGRASIARPLGATARRCIWGAAPEPAADPLWLPLDVHSPLPLFDGATPTQVTTLDNGLKVASSDLSSPCTTVGLYIATGSKFEAVVGTSHVLQHMAFKSSHGRSQLRMVRDRERIG